MASERDGHLLNQRLRRVCHPSPSEKNAWMAEPVYLPETDETLATDGKVAVFVAGRIGDALIPGGAAKRMIGSILVAFDGEWTPCTVDELLAWTGPYQLPYSVPCDCCGGDGKCECERCDAAHDCGQCDGSGQALEVVRVDGAIDGAFVDCNQLAYGLSMFVGQLCGYRVSATPHSQVVAVRGETWKLLVSCLEHAESPRVFGGVNG